MTDHSTITIVKGDNEVQYHDSYVPRIGEYFELWTSRDDAGNYHETGKTHLEIAGVVKKVSYLYEKRGRDRHSAMYTMYVKVELED